MPPRRKSIKSAGDDGGVLLLGVDETPESGGNDDTPAVNGQHMLELKKAIATINEAFPELRNTSPLPIDAAVDAADSGCQALLGLFDLFVLLNAVSNVLGGLGIINYVSQKQYFIVHNI
jgi:hypothetical protein